MKKFNNFIFISYYTNNMYMGWDSLFKCTLPNLRGPREMLAKSQTELV